MCAAMLSVRRLGFALRSTASVTARFVARDRAPVRGLKTIPLYKVDKDTAGEVLRKTK